MYDFFTLLKLIFILFFFCLSPELILSNPNKSTIKSIPVPVGFQRISVKEGSFAGWVRNLALKPLGSPVLDYRGKIYKRGDDSTIAAVVDWNIKGKKMEQCMDILIHFYAEYLWQDNCINKIRFPLPGGYWLDWNHWKMGGDPNSGGLI